MMKINRLFLLLRTLFALACGILLLIFPSTSASTLGYIAAGAIVLSGILQGVFSLLRKKASDKPHGFAQGLLLFCAGIFMLLRADLFGSLIPYLLAFVVLGYGCLGLEAALVLRREGSAKALPQLIAGAVIAVYAIMLLFIPFADRALNYIFIGIGFMLAGIASVIPGCLHLRKKETAHEA